MHGEMLYDSFVLWSLLRGSTLDRYWPAHRLHTHKVHGRCDLNKMGILDWLRGCHCAWLYNRRDIRWVLWRGMSCWGYLCCAHGIRHINYVGWLVFGGWLHLRQLWVGVINDRRRMRQGCIWREFYVDRWRILSEVYVDEVEVDASLYDAARYGDGIYRPFCVKPEILFGVSLWVIWIRGQRTDRSNWEYTAHDICQA